MGRAAKRKWKKRLTRIQQLEASVSANNQWDAKNLRQIFEAKLQRKTA